MRYLKCRFIAALVTAVFAFTPAYAIPPDTFQSVVSVLPVWPGKAQGGMGARPGTVPEGSGVVIAHGGLIATAWHVIKPAKRIDVRLADGRILPATVVGHDVASDIAVLRVKADLPTFVTAPQPILAQPVCTIGNTYGFGLSVTCGVVSAVDVSTAGFNEVEDYIQTDAAVNPGGSGGALVDTDGRLVGMVSAIFASRADTNIGVNFAVSARLLKRVVDDLSDDGVVTYVTAGWQLSRASRAQLAEVAGALVSNITPQGAAAVAGVEPADLILQIGSRRVLSPRDAAGALALVLPGNSVDVTLLRGGQKHQVRLSFGKVVP